MGDLSLYDDFNGKAQENPSKSSGWFEKHCLHRFYSAGRRIWFSPVTGERQPSYFCASGYERADKFAELPWIGEAIPDQAVYGTGGDVRFAFGGMIMTDYHINIFYSEEDGGYIADIPDLAHCSAFGETPEHALEQVLIAKKAWLEAARAEGKAVP